MMQVRSEIMFTLVRKVDFNYTTNRIILVFSIITGIIGYFMTGSLSSGISLAGSIFLTWALTREVDPKHEYSAFLSAALSLVNLFYFESLNLLVLFWIILLLRMISGVCGKSLTLVDFIVVFGFSVYLSVRSENSVYLIPFLIASVSLLFYKEKPRTSLVFSVLAVAVFLMESFHFNFLSISEPFVSPRIELLLMSVLILFPAFTPSSRIAGVLDDRGTPVHVKRMNFSQKIFSFIVLLLYLFPGIGLNNLIIYYSIVAAVAIYPLIGRKTA